MQAATGRYASGGREHAMATQALCSTCRDGHAHHLDASSVGGTPLVIPRRFPFGFCVTRDGGSLLCATENFQTLPLPWQPRVLVEQRESMCVCM